MTGEYGTDRGPGEDRCWGTGLNTVEFGVVLEGVLRESPYPGPGDMRLGP